MTVNSFIFSKLHSEQFGCFCLSCYQLAQCFPNQILGPGRAAPQCVTKWRARWTLSGGRWWNWPPQSLQLLLCKADRLLFSPLQELTFESFSRVGLWWAASCLPSTPTTRRRRWKRWRRSSLESSLLRKSGGWASLKGELGESLLPSLSLKPTHILP